MKLIPFILSPSWRDKGESWAFMMRHPDGREKLFCRSSFGNPSERYEIVANEIPDWEEWDVVKERLTNAEVDQFKLKCP